MKIRIKGNSIRYRLDRNDIEKLSAENYVEERTEFLENVFIYSLEVTESATGLSSYFNEGKICMLIPSDLKEEWVSSERVGYSGEMNTGNGRKLRLLLEKDFMCLNDTSEDQSAQFPNPDLKC